MLLYRWCCFMLVKSIYFSDFRWIFQAQPQKKMDVCGVFGRCFEWTKNSWVSYGPYGAVMGLVGQWLDRTVAKPLSPMAPHAFVSDLKAVQQLPKVQDCHVFIFCPWLLRNKAIPGGTWNAIWKSFAYSRCCKYRPIMVLPVLSKSRSS